MVERSLTKPDITITLDSFGVIRNAVSSHALEEESLDDWRGRPWGETIHPAIDDQVLSMIEAIRRGEDSSCFQVRQRFPSGLELPIEYTTISLGEQGGFVAVGKSLQTVADLQSRLHAAQKAREQDYWKLREIETRYRLLFEASNEAVALVRVTNLRVVEANVTAAKTLGLVPGGEFLRDLAARDQRAFDALLEKVREQGRAPAIALHLTADGEPWSLRASMMTTQADAFYLFQMSPLAGEAAAPQARRPSHSADDILQRLPDAFAIVDRAGAIHRANNTFLDLAQIGSESAAVGQKMGRWLSRPGADMSVILGMVARHGSVRMMTTTLEGELGSVTEVEVSAVGDKHEQADYVGMVLRDVSARSRSEISGREPTLEPLGDSISLESIVRASTEAIERSTITTALHRFQGHRTATAKYLGLSRQSLHSKLKKYGFEEK